MLERHLECRREDDYMGVLALIYISLPVHCAFFGIFEAFADLRLDITRHCQISDTWQSLSEGLMDG